MLPILDLQVIYHDVATYHMIDNACIYMIDNAWILSVYIFVTDSI